MTNAEIYINLPINPQFPLMPIVTAQGGSVYVQIPLVPAGVTALALVLTAPGSTEPVRIPLGTLTAGAWVEAYLYPSIGLGGYEIVGSKDGRRIWFGRGDWQVIESAAFGDPGTVSPPSVEINAGYLPVAYDEDGAKLYRRLSVVVEEETGEPVSQWSRQFYRFNLATGVYEEVK